LLVEDAKHASLGQAELGAQLWAGRAFLVTLNEFRDVLRREASGQSVWLWRGRNVPVGGAGLKKALKLLRRRGSSPIRVATYEAY